MAKSKGVATLSGMVDTDMEDDTLNGNAFPSPDSNQENGGPRRKGAKTQPASKKPLKKKAPLSRAGGTSPVKKDTVATKPGKKRAPLKNQNNQHYTDETEEVDEFAAQSEGDMEVDDVIDPQRRAKSSKPARREEQPVKNASRRPAIEPERDGEFEYTPTSVRVNKGARAAPIPMIKKVIQETQAPTETEESMLLAEDDNAVDHDMPQSTYRRPTERRNGSQRRQPLNSRHRAGSASDTDRAGSDPATRRKLGEMSRKFESLDLKYRNLREVGIKQAEANFEKLRIQSDAKAQLASDLIKSLKKELATHKALNADTTSIQNEILTRDADLRKAHKQADDLSKQLADAQNENKALQAKLANFRSVSATVESLDARRPASGLRAWQQTQSVKTVMVGSAEAAQAAQVAQLKEDLYSDLTGLIMRGVEMGKENDTYDCIQTGPNGSKFANPKVPYPETLPFFFQLVFLCSSIWLSMPIDKQY